MDIDIRTTIYHWKMHSKVNCWPSQFKAAKGEMTAIFHSQTDKTSLEVTNTYKYVF